jgi:oxygen-dependent protoporphyrinogen oxidase
MQTFGDTKRRYAIIGAGISGLAAAHRIVELDPGAELHLFESRDRLGGVLHSERRDGFLIEESADNFITNLPWATDLCDRIGLEPDLLPTKASQRRASVVCRGKLEEVPAGFVVMAPREIRSILRSPILSWAGKLRLAWEFFEPPRVSETDESVADFSRRRMGREVFQRLVQPLVGGIYTADPEKLSMAATMPQFVAMERAHGSLARAAIHAARQSRSDSQDSGARYSLFRAPRDGMSSIIEAIAQRLPAGSIRLNTAVERIARLGHGKWSVVSRSSKHVAGVELESFDGVLIATPVSRAATLVQESNPRLSNLLGQIECAGASVVVIAFRDDQFAAPLEGFGFVVPAIEGRAILSVSYSSRKYPGRAPEGFSLLRVFVGGALQPELAELPDDQLLTLVRGELEQLLHVRGAPLFTRVVRYPNTMPQYHLGHLERVDQIEQIVAGVPGLELAGNAYRGVGIPQCIHGGESAAERLLKR